MSRHAAFDPNDARLHRNAIRNAFDRPVHATGLNRIDVRTQRSVHGEIRVERLIDEDDSMYEADEHRAGANEPDRFTRYDTSAFYENPYSSCENSALSIPRENIEHMRDTFYTTLSNRRGIRMDYQSLNAPLPETLLISRADGTSGSAAAMPTEAQQQNTTTTTHATTHHRVDAIELLAQGNDPSRRVPWQDDSHVSRVAADKLAYTTEHSTIVEFKLVMGPKLYMDPTGPESFRSLTRWIEYITAIGLYYLGAQQVINEDPNDASSKAQLIFAVDLPETPKDYPEHLIPTEQTIAKTRRLRPWDPLPEISAEDKAKGKVDMVRVNVHCVFETPASDLPTNKSMIEYRFVFYYYTN